MSNKNIKCESCNKFFHLEIEVGDELNGLHDIYFVCPYCKKYYHCYYENFNTRNIQNKINILNVLVQNTRIIRKNMNLEKEFNNRQKYLGQINNLKKDKYKILKKINKENDIFS